MATEFARDKQLYLIYGATGLLIGAIARPILIWLASYSMPPSWLEERARAPFSWQHFVEPFWAAGRTLGTWGYIVVAGAYRLIIDVFTHHPSGVTLGIIGAALGFWIAYRKEHKPTRRH